MERIDSTYRGDVCPLHSEEERLTVVGARLKVDEARKIAIPGNVNQRSGSLMISVARRLFWRGHNAAFWKCVYVAAALALRIELLKSTLQRYFVSSHSHHLINTFLRVTFFISLPTRLQFPHESFINDIWNTTINEKICICKPPPSVLFQVIASHLRIYLHFNFFGSLISNEHLIYYPSFRWQLKDNTSFSKITSIHQIFSSYEAFHWDRPVFSYSSLTSIIKIIRYIYRPLNWHFTIQFFKKILPSDWKLLTFL